MKGMSTKGKRILFIAAGLLIFVATFLLVFKKNMDEVSKLNTENAELNGQINYLSELQIRIDEMKQTTELKQQEIEKYTQEFPCKMTQQKAISNLSALRKYSKLEYSSIKPGEEQIFFREGKYLEPSSEGGSVATTEGEDTSASSEAEKNPEAKLPVDKMVGKYTSYEIELSGTRKQVLKALDWVSNNPEHMSVNAISLSFDPSTGKLTGSITVCFYCLNGNGSTYVEPDISGITLGSKDVFGTFKKKGKKK